MVTRINVSKGVRIFRKAVGNYNKIFVTSLISFRNRQHQLARQRSVPTFDALCAISSMHAAIIKPTKPKNESSYSTEIRALVGLQAGTARGHSVRALSFVCRMCDIPCALSVLFDMSVGACALSVLFDMSVGACALSLLFDMSVGACALSVLFDVSRCLFLVSAV